MSKLFEKWPTLIRWIMFIPMIIITYFITILIGRFLLWWSIGPEDISLGNFLMYHFYNNFICFVLSLAVSIACAPKGKVIIASIYLGVILVSLGFSLFSVFVFGAHNNETVWRILYDYILNTPAGIFVLIATVKEKEMDRNNALST